MTEVLVVGAGPAGMSAAIALQARGLVVTIVDDQPAPGGRIFAAIERRVPHTGEDREGARLVSDFRAAGGTYLSGGEVWQIEQGRRVFLSHQGAARMIEPDFIILATGAQERPMPFPGWEMPGVMTIGAAQILLKVARQIPEGPVWLAGSGPLLLLYAHQLLAAGGEIAGILDTTVMASRTRAIRFLPGALRYGWRDMLRGLRWMAELRRVPIVRQVTSLEALGNERLDRILYTIRGTVTKEVEARLLLVHDGVVPGLHGTLAAGCDHHWNAKQRCFEPVLGRLQRSSVPTIFVAGDGAAIAGARAARLSGRLAAIGVAEAAGTLSVAEADLEAQPIIRQLSSSKRFRRFLDEAYPPVGLPVPDEAIVCRCEEVTASTIRAAVRGREHLGTDGVKIATRAAMGPCQGRQCGLTLARLVAEANHGCSDVQFPRIRPPLKPLSLGELAALEAMR